ncbi:MAG: SpoIIE family protein phosphatase [Ruthenibacterium lactatiformans]
MKQAIFTRCCATVWAPVRRRRWAACWRLPYERAAARRVRKRQHGAAGEHRAGAEERRRKRRGTGRASIDLYTGDAVLYKAGAAASFLLRDGKAAVYSGDTLPIGILGSVTGRRELLCLSPGDTAVLVSDGALAPGASWLRAQLVAHADDAPQKLADAVARAAREKQQDMPDDVTVMALRLRAVE